MSDDLLDSDLTTEEKPKLRYADFGIRLVATIVDSVIFAPLLFLNYYNIFDWKSLTIDLSLTVLLFLYKPLMEWKYGATLGKMAVKIKVVNYQKQKIDLNQAFLRFLPWAVGYFASALASFQIFNDPAFADVLTWYDLTSYQEKNVTLVEQMTSSLTIISAMFITFDLQKQALHDKLAGTFCIYEN